MRFIRAILMTKADIHLPGLSWQSQRRYWQTQAWRYFAYQTFDPRPHVGKSLDASVNFVPNIGFSGSLDVEEE